MISTWSKHQEVDRSFDYACNQQISLNICGDVCRLCSICEATGIASTVLGCCIFLMVLAVLVVLFKRKKQALQLRNACVNTEDCINIQAQSGVSNQFIATSGQSQEVIQDAHLHEPGDTSISAHGNLCETEEWVARDDFVCHNKRLLEVKFGY